MIHYIRLLGAGFAGSAIIVAVACAVTTAPLCERLKEIRSIPMKGEGDDQVYTALIRSGEAEVPCLIEKISDTTRVPDPRMAPKYAGVVVGDLAVFILVRITRTDFEALLPEAIQESYRVRGVYAYFEYVAAPANRLELQGRWRNWWSQQRTGREHVPGTP